MNKKVINIGILTNSSDIQEATTSKRYEKQIIGDGTLLVLEKVEKQLNVLINPIIIPISKNIEKTKRLIDLTHGVIIPGGSAINPTLYRKPRGLTGAKVDNKRDAFDLIVLEYCVKQSKPVFGICRGLQIISVYYGYSKALKYLKFGNKSQHEIIESTHRYISDGVDQIAHETIRKKSVKNSIFSKLPNKIWVNSLHSHFICNKTVEKINKKIENKYKKIIVEYVTTDIISAKEDDTNEQAEMISIIEDNVFAVQWHPELLQDEISLKIIGSFIEKCRDKL